MGKDVGWPNFEVPDNSRLAPAEQPYILDERVGCVAIYRGPQANCLDEVSDDDKVVFDKPLTESQMRGLRWLVSQMNKATPVEKL